MFPKIWQWKINFWSFMSVLTILVLLISIVPAAPTQAQEQVRVVSPEVLPDGTVTFRYYDPTATQVQLYIEMGRNALGAMCYGAIPGQSGWPVYEMTFDVATGIWSYTIPTMEPNVYNYHFNVWWPGSSRSTLVIDPSNPAWNPAALNTQLYVPGPGNEWQSIQDVPHGQLQEVFYFSTATGTDRPLTVYTPPDYDKSSRTYPTLYLSHGAGGNHVDWTTQGVANNILDNLIAQHKIRPMVVVMTNFNGIPGGTNGYRLDVIDSVIPAIESMYRVNNNPDQRAFAGLSAGGSRAANILVNSPWEFGFIGIWSMGGLTQSNLLPNLDAIRMVRGIDISVGAMDFTYNSAVQSMAALDYYGIPYTGLVTPGDCHTWYFWREALYQFLVGPLFKIN